MGQFHAIVSAAEGFDPRSLYSSFATDTARRSDGRWDVTFETDLHALGLLNASGPSEVTTIAVSHPVDPDGWADWRQSGPGESEMTDTLLPTIGTPRSRIAYRYEDSWLWDTSVRTADAALVARLGLQELSTAAADAELGKGSWVFKALKWSAKATAAGVLKEVAFILAKQAWTELKRESAISRAEYTRQEFERRLLIELAESRRARLESGTSSSRRKARQYYTALDALIAANS